MAISNSNYGNVFDFSLDAADFKKKLWLHLQEVSASAIESLTDEDLAWVNAAGVPHLPPKSEDLP